MLNERALAYSGIPATDVFVSRSGASFIKLNEDSKWGLKLAPLMPNMNIQYKSLTRQVGLGIEVSMNTEALYALGVRGRELTI